MNRVLALCLLLLAVLAPAGARAETRRLALIIGVNRSVDSGVPPLHFADDDAARYFDLFDTLGIHSLLLTRVDESTRRLHGQAAAVARAPRLKDLDAAVAALSAEVRAAAKEGLETQLYVVYAGHGNVENGTGYVALEDARLTGKELETRIVDRVHAQRTHFIIDACQSFFLAYARGPGGERRKVSGFSELGTLADRPDVGMLLSTSSARESHEWARVQAGVFSHEVRSGLYGAADANHDGLISYREIAAFVTRANAAIANERYRPDVYAHPPRTDPTLLDLSSGLKRRVEVSGAGSEHYLLEDENGVYLAEFHNAAHQDVVLLRPRRPLRLFIDRLRDGQELVIDAAAPDVVKSAELAFSEPHAQTRGSAHEAFSKTFELPFGSDAVTAYRFRQLPSADTTEPGPRKTPLRRYLAFGMLGASAAAATGGGVALLVGAAKRDVPADASQTEVDARNRSITSTNRLAAVSFAASGATLAAGVLLLVWPSSPVNFQVGPSAYGAAVHGAF